MEPSASAVVVVAARSVAKRGSKRPLKVVVYTPLVTVPALPVMEPWMVLVKLFVPEKVLLSARSVEEAAVTVPLPPSAMFVPFTVIEELARLVLGIEESESVPAEKLMPVAEETVALENPPAPFPYSSEEPEVAGA